MKESPTLIHARKKDSRPLSGFGLPTDLLETARRRLGRFALLMAAIFGVTFVLAESVALEHYPRDVVTVLRWGQSLAIVGHLVMFALTRIPRLTPTTVLRLGLAYEVALCLCISAGDSWLSYGIIEFVYPMNWSMVLIAVYPLIIPSPPRITFFIATLAAAMFPLSLWILEQLDLAVVDALVYVEGSMFAAISAAIAVFGSHLVFGMNRDVARARELGSYRLESRLGTGGMGEVWRAEHRLLARPAAIKLIRPELLGGGDADRHLKRFEREALATANLHSQNTVDLYDFGITPDGVFYYVMELLDGFDLDSLVRKFGPIRDGRAIFLLRQACESLGEAHEKGLVHRDVKPANIFSCHHGRDYDFVKVLDFGLVKGEGESVLDDDVKLTREQMAGGTPAFMAPEQILGKPLDGRTDLYALGCVAYWLVTGQLVFEGEAHVEVMTHHLRTIPVPPSRCTEIAVSESLDRVILQCLEKDPDKRPADADVLSAALAEVEVHVPWDGAGARHWWKQYRPQTD